MARRIIHPRWFKSKRTRAYARRYLLKHVKAYRDYGRTNYNPGKLVDPREIPPHKKDN